MSKQICTFKPGSHIRANPEAAYKVCKSLDDDGKLNPENLLDASRAEDAPLHDAFEWDDSEAAERYRVQQAAHIIRCLVVTVEDDGDKNPSSRPVYVSLHEPGKPKANYTDMTYAISKPDTRDIVLGNAIRELNMFKRKYARIKELANVIEAIDQLKLEGF